MDRQIDRDKDRAGSVRLPQIHKVPNIKLMYQSRSERETQRYTERYSKTQRDTERHSDTQTVEQTNL